jgi:hypothetical protein
VQFKIQIVNTESETKFKDPVAMCSGAQCDSRYMTVTCWLLELLEDLRRLDLLVLLVRRC